jgi:transcriptional regulator with XRE-family HTH domain
MSTVQQRFGQRVRALRQQRGWTQEQLGQKAGKHWTYIGGIERGTRNPTITVAEALARAFDVPLADLFVENGNTCSIP